MVKKKYLLIVILLIASIVRLWKLSSYPALNADEAALGYNAYSLIKTGADEHGNTWPLHFQSFNDYKPGLYVYLALPFIAFGGLNELSVRLPGVILGIGTVFIFYLLIRLLSKNEFVALISSLFLALNPWHIHFSRGAWEVNIATFFILWGVYLFIKGDQSSSKKTFYYWAISGACFVASLYAYHAARIVVPFFLGGIAVLYKKQLIAKRKDIILAITISAFLIAPLGIEFLGGNITKRAAGVGLFADKGPIERINEQRGAYQDISALPAKLFHNKFVNYSLAFAQNWTEHYWGEFLFVSGDEIQRNRVPETGQLYIFEVFLVIAGFIYISKNLTKENKLMLWWLVVAPIAASFTFQSPHALRAQNMVIPLVYISSVGLYFWITNFKCNTKKIGSIIFILVMIWSFTRYERMYWLHMSKEYPYSSQYGVKEMVEYISEYGEDYDNILVTTAYDQPYILYLFYTSYDPKSFQNDHVLTQPDEFGFSTVDAFHTIKFMPIDYNVASSMYTNTLVVGTADEIPEDAAIIKTVYFPNGDIAFRIANI